MVHSRNLEGKPIFVCRRIPRCDMAAADSQATQTLKPEAIKVQMSATLTKPLFRGLILDVDVASREEADAG